MLLRYGGGVNEIVQAAVGFLPAFEAISGRDVPEAIVDSLREIGASTYVLDLVINRANEKVDPAGVRAAFDFEFAEWLIPVCVQFEVVQVTVLRHESAHRSVQFPYRLKITNEIKFTTGQIHFEPIILARAKRASDFYALVPAESRGRRMGRKTEACQEWKLPQKGETRKVSAISYGVPTPS